MQSIKVLSNFSYAYYEKDKNDCRSLANKVCPKYTLLVYRYISAHTTIEDNKKHFGSRLEFFNFVNLKIVTIADVHNNLKFIFPSCSVFYIYFIFYHKLHREGRLSITIVPSV